MASIRQRPWWPGAVTGAVALGVTSSIAEPLALGGLAPLAVAAAVAALVGVPIARIEWRNRQAPDSSVGHGMDALGDVLLLSWLAALWARMWPGWTGAMTGVVVWLAAWAVIRIRRDVSVVALAGLCGVQAALAAGAGLVEAPPWTLLEPQWSGWSDWVAWSLLSGLLLTGAGLAHWSRGPASPPGTGHVPWLPAGLALLVTLGAACRAGSRFEADLGPEVDALGLGVAVLAVVAAAAAAMAPRPVGQNRQLAFGAIATLWFAGPGSGSVGWMLGVWLPLGIAAMLAHRARHLGGQQRYVCAVGATVALAALFLGFPGVPESPPQAVAAAFTGVALAWIAGTRALLAGGER